MPNFATSIAESLLRHDIDLMRIDAALRKKVVSVLNGLERDILAKIKRYTPSSTATAAIKNKQLKLLVGATQPNIMRAYKQIKDVTDTDLIRVASLQSGLVEQQLGRSITVDLFTNKVSPEILKVLPGKAMIEGAPFQQWYDSQSSGLQEKFLNQMRQGILGNEPIERMVQRVHGTRAAGFRDGIMHGTRTQAKTLVRSSVMATANKAREATYQKHKDVIKGMQWLSTLDSRTSDICVSLDGAAWDLDGKPIGTNKSPYLGPPPAHFNCRSTLVPITKSYSELTKNKKIKAKLNKLSKSKREGLRASMNGAISDKINYEQWLAKQPGEFQLKVLGPTKLRLWKAGNMHLRDLIDQSHRPRNVETLLAKFGVPDITLEDAIRAKLATETAVVHQKVASSAYKSSKGWYDEFADKTATAEGILATEDAVTIKTLEDTAARLKKAKTTEAMFKRADGTWSPQRVKDVHDPIINKILSEQAMKAATPAAGKQPTYIMFGGRGGSGKGSFTKLKRKGGLEVIDKERYIVLDADEIKSLIPGYEGWNAFLFHEESSHIFDQISQIARSRGLNVVHDMTLKTTAGAVKRAQLFTQAGYRMEGYYMFLPPQEAAKRAISRFRTFDGDFSGRFVPPQVVLSNTTNELSFDALKKYFKKWEFYDNQGASPVLVGKSDDLAGKVAIAQRAAAREAARLAAQTQKTKALNAAAKFTVDDAIKNKTPYLAPAINTLTKRGLRETLSPQEFLKKARETAATNKQRALLQKYKRATIAGKRVDDETLAAFEAAPATKRQRILDDIARAQKETVDALPAAQANEVVFNMFATSAKTNVEDVLRVINEAPKEQAAKLAAFLNDKPVGVLALTHSQLTLGKASDLIVDGVKNFLKLGAASKYDTTRKFTHRRAKGIAGFTSSKWDHVIVKVTPGLNFATVKLENIVNGVRDAIRQRMIPTFRPARTFTSRASASGASRAEEAIITIVHELGHQLHYWAGVPKIPANLLGKHVTWYGGYNEFEFHAEHFLLWLFNREAMAVYSKEMAEYFDEFVDKAIKSRTKTGKFGVIREIG